MNIERAIFVNDVLRGLYILEKCDTYTLYNPKRERCSKCWRYNSNFHWRGMSESDKIGLLFLSKEDMATLISKMIRLDIYKPPIPGYIPFEEGDISEH